MLLTHKLSKKLVSKQQTKYEYPLVVAREDFLDEDETVQLIKLAGNRNKKLGTTGPEGVVRFLDLHVRLATTSTIELTDETEWIYTKLHNAAKQVNQENYGFKLYSYAELSVIKYTKDSHYLWHKDIGSDVASTRKISMIVQLSDSDDYKGGEVELVGQEIYTVPKKIGCAVFFPSYTTHRVKPVTHGTRYSLVCWIHGPALR